MGFNQNHSPFSKSAKRIRLTAKEEKMLKQNNSSTSVMLGCWRTAAKEAAAMSENPQSASSVLLLARVLLLSAVSVLLLGTPWAPAWWTPWWTPWPPPARPWPAHCCSSLRIRTWYRRRHLSSDSVRALNVCISHKKLLTRLSFCRWNLNLVRAI